MATHRHADLTPSRIPRDSEPVAIGGVGGSGTRVLAHLIREMGFYIGDELNPALDNRWFALLCVRPHWRRTKPAQTPFALRLFEKAMRGERTLDPPERLVLREAVLEWTSLAPKWSPLVCRCARTLRGSSGAPDDAAGWGWKDPATHLFVEQLAALFPGMRYIHVIRDGLELAHKPKAKRQALAWGRLIGTDFGSDAPTQSPHAALRYWITANRRALTLGPRLFGDRFLVLQYESVCADPQGVVTALGEFLGVSHAPHLAERFAAFIDVPPTRRDRSWEATEFEAADLAEAKALSLAV